MNRIRVLIAEDEPLAAKQLEILTEQMRNYKVIDIAENGEEAIEKVREHMPDVLITDIRMPGYNGIEVLKCVKKINPHIYTIVVSGYADFTYAKGAIHHDAFEYLLKPVNLSQFRDTLSRLEGLIRKDFELQREEVIRALVRGKEVKASQINKIFPYKQYYGAIKRENGLPRRFFDNHGIEVIAESSELISLYGRDEMECLYIWPTNLMSVKKFETSIKQKQENKNAYTTTIIQRIPFGVNEISQIISELYKALAKSVTIGQSKVLYTEEINETQNIRHSLNHDIIRYYLHNRKLDDLKSEINKWMADFEKNKYPQLYVEKLIKQLILHITNSKGEEKISIDFLIEDAFYYATNYKELEASIYDILLNVMDCKDDINHKINTPEFFREIIFYVNQHMEDNISVTDVCNALGISQSYISRLFRKYTQSTFNNYINKQRIERAKNLFIENPSLLIKDVANLVGYQDQFYFSRIFRSITGETPTEYCTNLKEHLLEPE